MNIIKCSICNTDFLPRNWKAIYCEKCKKEHRHFFKCLNCNERFIYNNSKYCSENCKNNRSTLKYKKCLYCDKDFIITTPTKVYCTIKCNKAHKKTQNKIYICKICNTAIDKTNSDRNNKHKYCSNECARIGKNTTHICQYCNKEFIKNRGAIGKFCSKNCKNKSETIYKWKIKICPMCNKEFEIITKDRKYCSQNCCLNAWAKAENRGKKCIYNDIKLKSTWELRVCNILDKLKEKGEIYKWEYEMDSINYISFDNRQHRYIIDFKVYRDEISFYYIEVKGKLDIKDSFKFKAIGNTKIDFYVWFYKEMREQEELLNISKEDIKTLLKNGIIKK